MRILHCLDVSHRGGIQELIFSLHKHSSHTQDFWAADGSMASEMRSAGMVLWNSGPPAEAEYDVVVGHTVGGWSHDNLSAWAHERGCKFVECMHSPATSPTLPENVDGFIALNKISASLNPSMRNVQVIYGILDAGAFKPYNSGSQIAGRLSRLAHEKRPLDFVVIANALRDLKFVIAGDGPLMQQVRELAPSNMAIAGWVRDFPGFYQQLRMFVFPTTDECMCMSVAMAQAAGVPVLCQDIPALRETTGGYAIFCKDVPDFVRSVREHWSSDKLVELGQAGREWAYSQFDIGTTVCAWDHFLENV